MDWIEFVCSLMGSFSGSRELGSSPVAVAVELSIPGCGSQCIRLHDWAPTPTLGIYATTLLTSDLIPSHAGSGPQARVRHVRGDSVPADSGTEARAFARAVLIGLSDTPRWLPCRYLYDAHGSELFEAITEQPEYYPTRTEAAILERHASDIFARTGPVSLIELGSGSSLKTDHLLAAYSDNRLVEYVPIDVSDAAIEQATERIAKQHEGVRVSGIVGTYEEAFPLMREHSPAMVMFLGSTLGNFNQTESLMFWRRVSASLQPGDFFLLGADLVKDRAVLEAAYNDAAGVTAQFTRNLFARMNRELGSDIDLDVIRHVAKYADRWQRIEAFARFEKDQSIYIRPLDTTIELSAGDEIMIEISRKFVLDDLQRFLSAFDLETVEAYTDDRRWFAELLLRKV